MEGNNRKQFKVSADILAKLEQRFLNWFIDTVMQVLLFLVSFMIVANIAHSYGNKELTSYILINPIGQYTYVSIIRLIYYISLETLFGQSIGKFVSQTIVVDENGDKPNHEVILVRTLCRLIPFYEFSFFGILGRGWHDSISKTYVVNKNMLEEKKRQFHSLK